MYEYKCKIERVVDGDTVWANVDLGFYAHVRVPLRLEGVNAPELDTPAGEAARAYLIELVARSDSATVRTRKTEKYGRWLAVLWLPGEQLPVNQLMLDAGHAQPYRVR